MFTPPMSFDYILSHGVCWHCLLFIWAKPKCLRSPMSYLTIFCLMVFCWHCLYLFERNLKVYALPWAIWLYFVSWCFVGITLYCLSETQGLRSPWANWLYFVSWCLLALPFVVWANPNVYALPWAIWLYLSHGVLLSLPYLFERNPKFYALHNIGFILSHGVLLAWPFICFETQGFTLSHELFDYILSHGVLLALPFICLRKPKGLRSHELIGLFWLMVCLICLSETQKVYALPWANWFYLSHGVSLALPFICLSETKRFTLSHELFGFILSHGVLLASPLFVWAKSKRFALSHELFGFILSHGVLLALPFICLRNPKVLRSPMSYLALFCLMVFCWLRLYLFERNPKGLRSPMSYLALFCLMVFCWRTILFVWTKPQRFTLSHELVCFIKLAVYGAFVTIYLLLHMFVFIFKAGRKGFCSGHDRIKLAVYSACDDFLVDAYVCVYILSGPKMLLLLPRVKLAVYFVLATILLVVALWLCLYFDWAQRVSL